jgi:hypothetical protein
MYFRALIILLLTACTPSSRLDYYSEGESQVRALAHLLQKIHSKEDLVEESGVIKKRFNRLIDLTIKAEEYRKKHPDEPLDPPISTTASDMLQYEMQRLCEIEGATEILIQLQKNAFEKLDLSL